MKKKSLIFMILGVITILAPTLMMAKTVESYVEITEATKDAAYDAPASKIVGSWYYIFNSLSAGDEITNPVKYIYRANGTLDKIYETKIFGIHYIVTMKYTWKKTNNILTQMPVTGVNKIICEIAPESKEEYNALSTRKKAELKEELASYKKYWENDVYINEKYEKTLEYIGKDYIVLKDLFNTSVYENVEQYNQRKEEEARAKAKKQEEEARAKAEAEAKKAEAEAKKQEEEARAKAEAEEKAIAMAELEKLRMSNSVPADEISYELDKHPIFKGDVFEFINANFKYPEKAKKYKDGRVILKAVILKDGSIGQVMIDKKNYDDVYLDLEAVRIVKSMPNWQPGKRKGKEVNGWTTIPINFKGQI